MADTTKLPVTKSTAPKSGEWMPFESLRREIDRLFDDFRPFGWRLPSTALGLDVPRTSYAEWQIAPAIDLVEKDDAYEITAELPGLGEKDVELVLDGDILTLKGERKSENEAEQDGFVFSERFFGRFERRVVLPEEVDRERVQASMKDGVLTVKLAKTETPQRRKRIPINGR